MAVSEASIATERVRHDAGRRWLPTRNWAPGHIVRTAIRHLEERRAAWHRATLRLPGFDPRIDGSCVYFLAPDHANPAGGIQVLYRHVDILNAQGIRAMVLHQRPGFRCTWFENHTRIAVASRTRLGPHDLLVVPEIYVDLLARAPSEMRYVIFNQNSHNTWLRSEGRRGADRRAPEAVITVSEHNSQMLRYAFPGLAVERVHLGINSDLFHCNEADRPRRIAYMPRRAGTDANQVISMLRNRNALEGWELVALDGLSHEQVAAQLRCSRLFLAFTYQEGFGLPAAEAMAAGNYVVGYPGFAGAEFFRPEFSAPIPVGDVTAFAQAVEAALRQEREEPDWCQAKGRAASRHILSTYSREKEISEVATLYRKYLGIAGEAS